MSEQNKRPLTEAEQLSILHHAITTWRRLKLEAFLDKIEGTIASGRLRHSKTPEEKLAYEKELFEMLTGDLFRDFFDDSDRLEEFRKTIAQQECPESYSFTDFYDSFDDMLTELMAKAMGADKTAND